MRAVDLYLYFYEGVQAHCTKKADEVVPLRNVWLVHTIEVYDLIVI